MNWPIQGTAADISHSNGKSLLGLENRGETVWWDSEYRYRSESILRSLGFNIGGKKKRMLDDPWEQSMWEEARHE